MFRAAEMMILNKIDLLPYVRFDAQRYVDAARRVDPAITALPLSAETGEDLDNWYGGLCRLRGIGAPVAGHQAASGSG